MTLSQELDALMLDHKAKMDSEMQLLQRLDSVLLDSDSHIIRQIERIKRAHEERRHDAVSLLRDLHSVMLGSKQSGMAPPIEQRYASLDRLLELRRGVEVKDGLTFARNPCDH